MKKERYPWMDYVKLFAAVMILTGHFHDAAFDFCTLAPAAPVWYRVLNEFLVPFQNGKFWIVVFCIISGFLGTKEIRTFRDLVAECIVRYLRFFIPLLIVNVCSFGLYKAGLYYSGAYGSLMGNTWIGGHYVGPFRISDVAKQSIFFGAALDSSLWMIRPLFAGNLLILFTRYLTRRLPKRTALTAEGCVQILLMLAALRITTLWYCAAVYLGLLIFDTKKSIFRRRWIAVFALGALCIYYLPFLAALGGRDWSFLNQPRVDFFAGVLFTIGFFYSDYRGKAIGKCNLGSISFWVFVLHSPILCSLSCGMLLHFAAHFWLGFFLAEFMLLAVTMSASVILSQTLDRWTGRLLKKLKAKLIA